MVLSEKIFLRNGFKEEMDTFFQELVPFSCSITVDNKFHIVALKGCSNYIERDWTIHVDNVDMDTIGNVDIATLEQFNKFMEILDIEFQLI